MIRRPIDEDGKERPLLSKPLPILCYGNNMPASKTEMKKMVVRSPMAGANAAAPSRTHIMTAYKSETKKPVQRKPVAVSATSSLPRIMPAYDEIWLDMYNKLIAYKKRYNSTNPPKHYHDLKLVNWVNTQRLTHSKGHLRADRIAMLDEINFQWWNNSFRSHQHLNTPKIDCKWNIQYLKLLEFRDTYGHCDIPRFYNNDTTFCKWMIRQRYLNNRNDIRQDRKQLLIDAGFIWKVDADLLVARRERGKFLSNLQDIKPQLMQGQETYVKAVVADASHQQQAHFNKIAAQIEAKLQGSHLSEEEIRTKVLDSTVEYLAEVKLATHGRSSDVRNAAAARIEQKFGKLLSATRSSSSPRKILKVNDGSKPRPLPRKIRKVKDDAETYRYSDILEDIARQATRQLASFRPDE
ncbi:hypothetical protein MPSEU_000745200 [Mayamaea pseudoterrestris]|nr:hypothetical protein MPSEU_000745200 [Mayamaea pseudoterrestris]